jgi:ATP-dependent helicase HrpB
MEMRIGNIVLQSKPLHSPDNNLVQKAIIEAIKNEGEHLLDFNEEVKQWQNRVMCLQKWNPETSWPDVSVGSLLKKANEWLSPYLVHVKKNEDLKKLDLIKILQYHLPADQQKALDKLAPQRIEVPSGSMVKLKYNSDGSTPVLAVRLQETFGMLETPVINQGKIPVLMHLLSPGFKLVQITSDLSSFWNDAYFEVRKEMKQRYPKHFWPEKPLEAEAVRGVKRKKS